MPTPNLGYGNTAEADLDAFNQWFRAQPQYAAKLAEFGQTPNNVHLNDAQKQEVVKLAQSMGAVIDEGHNGQEVDDSGNFRAKGHKLRNTLIVAGIAAAALATAGAAGAFGGAAAAGGEGAAAAGGAGATAAGTGATLAGVEGGAAGLSDAALAGLGTGAMGATGVGAGIAGAAGATADAAGAANDAFDAAGNFIGPSTVTGLGGGASTLSTISDMLKKGASAADIIAAIGSGVGKATTAAGNNRLDQEQLALQANGQNIAGNNAFENAILGRAKQEGTERTNAAKDVYRASYATNPRVSPFDTVGAPVYSDAYKTALSNLSNQGSTRLATGPTYSTDKMAPVTPYTPIDIKNVQGSTNTAPSTLEQVGNVLSPSLTVAEKIAQLLKQHQGGN